MDDGILYFKFLAALLFVLGLIGLLALLARRFSIGLPATARPRDGKRRLSIVETARVDPKRMLVLVRRDDTEHLILLGAASELLVEGNIKTAQPATLSTTHPAGLSSGGDALSAAPLTGGGCGKEY